MVILPFRRNVLVRLPAKRESARGLIREATNSTLQIDEAAFEILSGVSGRRMLPSLCTALLPSLQEHIGSTHDIREDHGPLALVDVLGAILGIAHFGVTNRGTWLFVRIPETDQKSADIFALPVGGSPWFLELKAVGPLSADVAQNTVLDTCVRIHQQRNKALEQLNGILAEPPVNTPAVLMRSDDSVLAGLAQGGKALSIVVVPDGALGRRQDIIPPRKRGCPPNKRCGEHCLAGTHVNQPTSVVGLLWQKPSDTEPADPAQPDRLPSPWEAALLAWQALNAAVWADSSAAADDALDHLAQRLIREEIDRTRATQLLLRALAATRFLTVKQKRQQITDDLIAHLQRGNVSVAPELEHTLRSESASGLDQLQPVLLWNSSQFYELPGVRAGEVSINYEGYEAIGRFTSNRLTLAPSLSLLDRGWTLRDQSHWLNTASAALRYQILPRLLGLEPEQIKLSPIGIRLSQSEELWEVGKAWSPIEGQEILLDIAMPLRAKQELTQALELAGQRGDPNLLRKWEHGYPKLVDLLRDRPLEMRRLCLAFSDVSYPWLFKPFWPFFDRQKSKLSEVNTSSVSSTWAAFDGRIQVSW